MHMLNFLDTFSMGITDGAPVQGREDLWAQRALTKVITFASLQRH